MRGRVTLPKFIENRSFLKTNFRKSRAVERVGDTIAYVIRVAVTSSARVAVPHKGKKGKSPCARVQRRGPKPRVCKVR